MNLNKIRKLNAKLHLKFKCPKCPEKTRKKRDIFHQGECFWYKNWKKGRYNIISYQANLLFKKLGIKKSLFVK